jgi:SAM-dependent methyltransferase
MESSTITQGTARVQGALWGTDAETWAEVQEPVCNPLYEAAFRELAVRAGTRLLDAGCGAGGACAIAAALGAEISGFDASHTLLEVASRRVPEGDFQQGELESLPYADSSFDAVTGFNSFQYAAQPVNALREACRVLKPDGRVLVATWGAPERCEAFGYIKALGALLPPPPPRAPGPFALSEDGALELLVEEAGLRPLDRADVDCPWLYPDLPTALRGLLAAGPAIRAIQEVGREAVERGATEAIAPFRDDRGGYRLENVFRYVVAAR